ncbi:hypothetical protein I8D67_000995 [Vibrio parahaemolyticus]|uniref:S016 n=1 Tax=Proteus mirabilis TaxID=584 RepID=A0A565DIP4_PROMI|nr:MULTISPECIES: hypothetical protein [Gammaproteobacteria]MBC6385580.1 hypothetical protein [Proteus mirabilis]PIQ00218.1 MAG: hypothetical protein COW76_11610 [Shewanella sp. CG18_big_fil_WC_8_21_14_2_50_42_11]PIX71184.1 MAG: hypothetical protein COZ42_11555 [Shewanella sp. CG_4_10_14_3_um_filter_42_91]PIY67929.1 MAG: hypothetical protein COY92_02995 [Shewanella sp. CG_4_10_14_0_8_um_filter_42_13]PJB91122.1 MAG: hypothetical protein CO084_13220 [Shewanella sp. CG_4_9_14_0_8_um_filter_42_14]
MYRLILTNQKKRTREYQPSDAGYRAALKATRKFLEQNPQGNAVLYGHGVCESFTIRNVPEA